MTEHNDDIKNQLSQARQKLNNGNFTFVLLNAEMEICLTDRGIKPLFETYRHNPDALKGAVLADKVIGKAAAVIAVLGGVKAISTPLATVDAVTICRQNHIFIEADKVVEHILNRTQTDWCPTEKLAVECKSFEELPELIATFLASIAK